MGLRSALIPMVAAATLSATGYQPAPGNQPEPPAAAATLLVPARIERDVPGNGSVDPLRRMLACQRLQARNDPEALASLLMLARDADDMVRAHAVAALGAKRGPAVVTALVAALATGDWRARRCAAEALAGVDSPEARSALLNAMKDDSRWVRIEASRALHSGDVGRLPSRVRAS